MGVHGHTRRQKDKSDLGKRIEIRMEMHMENETNLKLYRASGGQGRLMWLSVLGP